MPTDRCFITSVLVLTVFLLTAPFADSQVYRYQDENGVWHYTDSPPEQEGVEAEQISSGVRTKAASVGRDLQKQLLEKAPPKNKIEEARNATISVETALGSGAGFFISQNGYLVTCKHVITGTGIDLEKTEQEVESAGRNLKNYDEMLEKAESWLATEQIWLTNAKKELEEIDRQVKAGEIRLNSTEIVYYNTYVSEYNTRLTEFNRRQVEYNRAKEEHEHLRTQFDEDSRKLDEINAKLAFQRGYQITLADKTVLEAEQVVISDVHDLALLKLDGYKTPHLRRGDAGTLAQGQTLYAIGNPLQLDHSVTSGVFSGRREGLLQISAQINPGNSGGPVVNEAGQVIGINTMKLSGENIEGIGFAIPIEIVLEEFGTYLK